MSSRTLPSIRSLVGLMTAASLVACATPPSDQDPARHYSRQSASAAAPGVPGSSSAQGGMAGSAMTGSDAGCGMMGAGMAASQAGCPMMGDSKAAGGMQHMDKESMCAMYRSLRDAPNEQARQAMMDRNMQGMSPGMRQHRMDMMRQQCQ